MSESTLSPLEASAFDTVLTLDEAVALKTARVALARLKSRHNQAAYSGTLEHVRRSARMAEAFDTAGDVLANALIAAAVYGDSQLARWALEFPPVDDDGEESSS